MSQEVEITTLGKIIIASFFCVVFSVIGVIVIHLSNRDWRSTEEKMWAQRLEEQRVLWETMERQHNEFMYGKPKDQRRVILPGE